MDFIRSTIKALFHDVPLKDVFSIASQETEDKDFYDRIEELLTHRETSFSGKEIEGLKHIFNSEWLGNISGLPSFSEKGHTMPERIFIILKKFGETALNTDQENPRIKFTELLRWSDLSRYVEENVLILPHLVCHDIGRMLKRTSFVWPNVIRHDNSIINGILETGISDIHCHLYASTDVFEFNWLSAMNFPETISIPLAGAKTSGKDQDPDFLTTGRKLSYDTVYRFGGVDFSLNKWILIAAWLRLRIYRNLIDEAETPWQIDPKEIHNLTQNPNPLYAEIRATRAWLNSTGRGMKSSNNFMLDYLISDYTGVSSISPADIVSPYMIHHGERWLLYSYFLKYFGEGNENVRNFAPYIWLYIAIRSKIRREFVQVNQLVGFDNFQRYQRRKTKIIRSVRSEKLNEISVCYAIQSVLYENPNNYIEGRITPSAATRIIKLKYQYSIFGNEKILSDSDAERFKFVIHFLKSCLKDFQTEGMCRDAALNKRYAKDLICILKHQEWQTENKKSGLFSESIPEFVGIDAAGAELGCRPEVFKFIFKKAREKGIYNFTYHAGEDFYDLLDGLRAIDEVIIHLNFGRGCRLGHGLALATDSKSYYSSRHNTMILPAQELLDNLIWMKQKGDELDVKFNPSTQAFISQHTSRLIRKIGYVGVNADDYWLFLKNRPYEDNDEDRDATNIWKNYNRNAIIISNGNQTEHIHPLPRHWAEDVALLQEAMLFDFEKKGIVIECNPTSNMRIGRFKKYAEHPVFTFHGVKYNRRHSITVTVNTDDSGVFATSLSNEYSLLAAALYKETDEKGRRLYSDREIEEYMEMLVQYGNRSRFRI